MAHAGEVAVLAAARHLAESAAGIIGSPLRSAILHGSLATGDFLPGRSDIDLLVVTDGTLTEAEIRALESLVRQTDIGDVTGIDLHVVTADVAGTPMRVPMMELHIGRYDTSPTGVEVEARTAAPDLPAELSMARADGRALIGVGPRDAIGPVPPEWVRERGRHWLTTWRSRTDDAENAAHMVLTACRIWHFGAEGVHYAKTRAAEWVLDRDPSLTAVRQALRRYTTDPAAPIDEEGIARMLETAVRETTRLR